MSFRVINGKLYPVEQFTNPSPQKSTTIEKNDKKSFKEILEKQYKKEETFVISNHAAQRLKTRNITFNESDMKTINEGINKAEGKGCKESLIMYKDIALLTSIKNRTVITAVPKEDSKDNIFTNIDSVLLL